jgi:hypothetical protein
MGRAQRTVRAAEDLADNKWFERLARLGYVANGVLHALIGALALNLAFGRSAEADQGGALDALSRHPLGGPLLWVCFLGCLLLGLWHLTDAVFHRGRKAGRRLKDAGIGVVFLAVGSTFGRYALGGSEDTGEKSSNISAELMSNPAGTVALVAVGAVLIGSGVFFVVTGVRRRFLRGLRTPENPSVARALTITGIAGYVAKGLVLASVGLLFIVATLQHDPQDATGLDGALKAVRDQEFGVPALALIGAGLVVYGVYLALRSRYDRME